MWRNPLANRVDCGRLYDFLRPQVTTARVSSANLSYRPEKVLTGCRSQAVLSLNRLARNPGQPPILESRVTWAERICGKWNLHGSMHIPTLALVIIRVAENL
jgi:hypothetical protein